MHTHRQHPEIFNLQTLSANKERHAALKDIFYTITSRGGNPLQLAYAVEVAFNNAGNKNASKRQKALSYLIAGYYLRYIDYNKDGQIIPSVLMLESGVRALHGEYFLEQHKKDWSRRLHNFWMITCNVIVAIAAIIALNISNREPRIILPQQQITISIDSLSIQKAINQIQNRTGKIGSLSN